MLIALSGKARSGKDTAADALKRSLDFVPMSFAQPLKDSCRFKFNLSWDDVHTQEGKDRFVPEWGLTVGEILQQEGTEATKGWWGKDFWIKRWLMDFKDMQAQGFENFVLTDCRFDEEAQMVLDLGGFVIHIERPGVNKLIGGRDANHPSEKGVDPKLITTVIVNDTSVMEFRQEVVALVKELMP